MRTTQATRTNKEHEFTSLEIVWNWVTVGVPLFLGMFAFGSAILIGAAMFAAAC